MINKPVNYIRLIVLIMTLLTVQSCATNKATESRKEAEKKEAAEAKEMDKQYEIDVSNHYKMQSKSTKRMMKKARKHQNKLNRYKKRSWFRRVFDSD